MRNEQKLVRSKQQLQQQRAKAHTHTKKQQHRTISQFSCKVLYVFFLFRTFFSSTLLYWVYCFFLFRTSNMLAQVVKKMCPLALDIWYCCYISLASIYSIWAKHKKKTKHKKAQPLSFFYLILCVQYIVTQMLLNRPCWYEISVF